MGADMIATVLWTENGKLYKEQALAALRAVIDAETDYDMLYEAAVYVGADVDELAIEVILADPEADASWRAKILTGYEKVIDKLEESFRSRDVSTIALDPLVGYITGGLSWGDTPTDSMDLWEKILWEDDPDSRAHPYASVLYRHLLVRGPGWDTSQRPGTTVAQITLTRV